MPWRPPSQLRKRWCRSKPGPRSRSGRCRTRGRPRTSLGRSGQRPWAAAWQRELRPWWHWQGRPRSSRRPRSGRSGPGWRRRSGPWRRSCDSRLKKRRNSWKNQKVCVFRLFSILTQRQVPEWVEHGHEVDVCAHGTQDKLELLGLVGIFGAGEAPVPDDEGQRHEQNHHISRTRDEERICSGKDLCQLGEKMAGYSLKMVTLLRIYYLHTMHEFNCWSNQDSKTFKYARSLIGHLIFSLCI